MGSSRQITGEQHDEYIISCYTSIYWQCQNNHSSLTSHTRPSLGSSMKSQLLPKSFPLSPVSMQPGQTLSNQICFLSRNLNIHGMSKCKPLSKCIPIIHNYVLESENCKYSTFCRFSYCIHAVYSPTTKVFKSTKLLLWLIVNTNAKQAAQFFSSLISLTHIQLEERRKKKGGGGEKGENNKGSVLINVNPCWEKRRLERTRQETNKNTIAIQHMVRGWSGITLQKWMLMTLTSSPPK